MAVIIEYNGVVIASASDGQTVRLACSGEVMKGNVVIRAIDDSLISFTIGGESYQAEAGMTWGEWCDTEYNTGGYYVSGNFVYANSYVIVRNASPNSSIIANEQYTTYQSGSGGDSE